MPFWAGEKRLLPIILYGLQCPVSVYSPIRTSVIISFFFFLSFGFKGSVVDKGAGKCFLSRILPLYGHSSTSLVKLIF